LAKTPVSGRDGAFAALALLRCRDRLDQVLDSIAEPRRSELVRAVEEFDGWNETRMKHALAELLRHQDSALKDAAFRALGAGGVGASRAIRRWITRGIEQ
jgi:hypothetical protein